MHDSQYMLPAEFVAVIAFLFAPPLLLAFLAQTLLFASRRMFNRGSLVRTVAAYIATVFGSLIVAAAIHQFAPRSFGPVLRVREVVIGGQSWPLMPLAFFAVAFAAGVVTWFVLSRAHAEA